MNIQAKAVGTTILVIVTFAVLAFIVSLSPVAALVFCAVLIVIILLVSAWYMVDTNKWPWE